MKTKKRQKLCYNCDGEIDLDVIVCPFCAADLRAEKPEQQTPSYNQSSSMNDFNTQQSLYPSKYGRAKAPEKREVVPPVEEEEIESEHHILTEDPSDSKSSIGPTILLTLGSQLFLFGLLMCLFQQNGFMTLKWDARLWYIYILASVPLVAFGYKLVSKEEGPQ